MQFQEKYYSWVTKSMIRLMHTSQTNGVKYTGVIMQDGKNTGNEVTASTHAKNMKSPGAQSHMLGGVKGSPTGLDKIFLVWSGKYKSTSEIPKQLEGDVIHRARSFGRIRINIGFLLLAAAGGGLMVYLGKKAASRGESLEQQNLEWHRKVKEQYESEQGKRK